MNDRSNTIAGWVLFAGIIGLGTSIVAGEYFHGGRPETMGYPIEGVVEDGEAGAEADKPIAFYLATADLAKGEGVFKKCASCHGVDQGGANGLGPNLWAIVGAAHAAKPGFAYSDALKGKPGNWDWDNLDAWFKSPKAYAPGTKMSFAGLSNPQDRADLIAFLNSKGSNLPLPAAPKEDPAAAGAPAGDKAAAEATGADAQKASNQPVLNEAQAATGGEKNVGGDAAKVSR